MAASETRGVVASTRREANDIGEAIFAKGGNAVDAAVAAVLAIGVAEPYMGGLGGVGEIVIALPDGTVHAIDAAARAPLAAGPDLYRIVGESTGLYAWPAVEGDANIYGARAVTAPQILQGLKTAHERFGSLPWADLVRPAAELARTGVAIDHFTAAILTHEAETFGRDPLAATLYYPGGRPIKPPIDGNPTLLKNAALARALDQVAEEGTKPFAPGGSFSQAILKRVAEGGILADDDFAPATDRLHSGFGALATFRGWNVFGSPLPSGSMTTASILRTLDAMTPFPTAADPARYAAIADASLAAFDDRLERSAAERFGGAAAKKARTPTATTHVSTIGADGMAVSVTQSLLSLFGAQIGVPEFGFFLNNGMMWFDPRAGRRASIAPGARAMMAISPLIAIDPEGGRRISAGALGARRIITAVAQLLDNAITYGDTLARAVDRPRVHADGVGPVLVDHRLPASVTAAIEAAAYPAETAYWGPTTLNFARASAVAFDPASGRFDKGIDGRARAVWQWGEDFA